MLPCTACKMRQTKHSNLCFDHRHCDILVVAAVVSLQLVFTAALSVMQLFRLLWLYSALYDLTGIGARGPKYPFPEAWRLGLGQIALASPFAVVGGGSETTGGAFTLCVSLHVILWHSVLASTLSHRYAAKTHPHILNLFACCITLGISA